MNYPSPQAAGYQEYRRQNKRIEEWKQRTYKSRESACYMSRVMEKEEAHKLIDRMPPEATWDDLMREIYVREAIECGLADSNPGRTKDVKEVRSKYGLWE